MVKQFDQSLIYLFIFRLCFLYSVQLVFNKLLVIYLFIFCQRHWNLVPEKTIEQLIKFWSKLWGGGLFDIEDSHTTNLVSCWQTEWIISSLPRASTARGSIFSDNPPKKIILKYSPSFSHVTWDWRRTLAFPNWAVIWSIVFVQDLLGGVYLG